MATYNEETLLQELKLNCDDDGREIDLEISASIFRKLGILYLHSKSSSTIEGMFSLIKCAVVLNAALVRTRSDANVIEKDLKQLYQSLLESGKAKQSNADLFEKTEKIKLSLDKMRKYVDKELRKIPKVEENESKKKMMKQERNKVKAIESLQNRITTDYTKIMAKLAKDCKIIMGKAPCKFAIIGMGSLARKEITPYSDFEHIIVLDSKINGENEDILNYFRWYSVIFQIILVNLGETIVPRVLNETTSKLGSWFYDGVTKSGVCFDGTFPWASKYPLGRQHATKNKDWKTELIKPVPDMLEYLNSDQNLKNGYHLADILTKVSYVYGDQSVFHEFKSKLNDIVEKQHDNQKDEILSQIKKDFKDFAVRSVLLKITDEGKCNVKKDIYRVTTLFIAAIGRFNKVTARSCFDIIRQLAKAHVISKNAKHSLMYAIAIACEIRLRWYMVKEEQKDDINGTNATSELLEIVGEASTFCYFQIAYALQCDISNMFDLKKGNFYSQPNMLNISIYSCFQRYRNVEDCMSTFEVNFKEQRLLDFDACLLMLKTKQTKSTQKKLTQSTVSERDKMLAKQFYLAGQNLLEMNKFTDAKEYLEKALRMQKRISNNVDTDKDVASTLHETGRCLIEMNKLTDAKKYLEKSLQIRQQLSNDVSTDKDVASNSYEMGRCLSEMNEFTDAIEYFERALDIAQKISNDVTTDRNMAGAFYEIGRCLIGMDKLTDAKEYLEKALKIELQISNDVTTDNHVASTLYEIGRCLIAMDKLIDAKEHLEKALKIEERISNDVTTDKDVASTSYQMGRCLIEMDKLIDAKEYLEKALKIEEQISSDVDTDMDVARTLYEMGRCLIKMDKHTDAKEYLDKALKIEERISNDVANDKTVARIRCEIDQCLIAINERNDAKEYLEKKSQNLINRY